MQKNLGYKKENKELIAECSYAKKILEKYGKN